jgi:hypothetical protein
MDSKIDLFGSARLLLLEHIRLMLVIEEFNDWLPRIAVVDIVTKSGGVDNREADWALLVDCHHRRLDNLTLEKLFF